MGVHGAAGPTGPAGAIRVIANLDCEVAWAGGPPLPAHVRAKLGALGTLLRALVPAGREAELVLPAPVDRARVPEVPEIDVPWRAIEPGAADGAGAGAGVETLRWGAPSSDMIRRVADRRFALALAREHGASLPGACAVDSIDELERAIAALPTAAWIAKAPITAAGRDRVRRTGPPDDATRARLARLFARGGALVVEPWLDRIADFGQSAVVAASGDVSLLPAHRLIVDERGGFAGIAVGAPDALGLLADEHARLRDVATAAGAALAAASYEGPFTIDAFAWRDERGARRFHPLCELNPRLTFGFVARAWADRLGGSLSLRVGAGAPPPGAITLVVPAPDDPTSAWLELESRCR